MINVKTDSLNDLEKKIYQTLIDYAKTHDRFGIQKASELCDCSLSKISKFVKKLGFVNFKQYLDFLYGHNLEQFETSEELVRIKHFIDEFDYSMTDEFYNLIMSHEKIVFFGFGPSFLCAQYFEYRLRTCSDKIVMAVNDELTISSMMDSDTLLIILTVSGRFKSFENIYKKSKAKNGEVAMVVEEYNSDLFNQCDRIFWLSKFPQPSYLKAHEKSRTIFFLFLEEVIQKIQNTNYTFDED